MSDREFVPTEKSALAVFGTSDSLRDTERAIHNVKSSTPVVAAKGDAGVVFGSLSSSRPLVEDAVGQRTHKISENIGCAMTGSRLDATDVLSFFRRVADTDRTQYNTDSSVVYLSHATERHLSDGFQLTPGTQDGVVCLFGGIEQGKVSLFEMLPNGQTTEYRAVAAGPRRTHMMDFLRESYDEQHSIEELRSTVVGALSAAHPVESDTSQLSVGEVQADTAQYRQLDSSLITDIDY